MSGKKPVSLKVRKDNLKKIKANLKKLSKLDLLVGVPQEEGNRDKRRDYKTKKIVKDENIEITNAELMFIHSQGSPARGIPKRPTIEPTIEENKELIQKTIKKIATDMLDGADGRVELEKLGIRLVNKIRAKFGSDELVPIKNATIKAKGSERPLIDTGQLRNSVTYVIRNKE